MWVPTAGLERNPFFCEDFCREEQLCSDLDSTLLEKQRAVSAMQLSPACLSHPFCCLISIIKY